MIALTSEFIAMGAFTAVVLGAAAFLFWCVVQMEREDEPRRQERRQVWSMGDVVKQGGALLLLVIGTPLCRVGLRWHAELGEKHAKAES